MSLTEASPDSIASSARLASRRLAILAVQDRNAALTTIHAALSKSKAAVLEANKRDLDTANDAVNKGTLSQSILKRLDLSRPGKYDDMLQGILDVRELADPLGKVDLKTELDDGLILHRQSCPIGVLLIIFEARPEVIANISALAIKSGNAAILKGGKESTESFKAISTIISDALAATKVPNDAIQLVTTRDAIDPLLRLGEYIDLVIPRGSNSLVRHCKEIAQMPVLGHADGLCHMYIHSDADGHMAKQVVVDSKTDYPAACNSLEVLLVHEDVLTSILPAVGAALLDKSVTILCDQQSKQALTAALGEHVNFGAIKDVAADDSDYDTEFLDLTLAIKTIPAYDDALDLVIDHINTHGSHHTDAILTSNEQVAEYFMAGVDSACKFWNCSTRMSDGMRFGFGTEVGISTNKIHARGPVGLEGLTIYEYRIKGEGQCAAMYSAQGGKTWKHRRMPIQQ